MEVKFMTKQHKIKRKDIEKYYCKFLHYTKNGTFHLKTVYEKDV